MGHWEGWDIIVCHAQGTVLWLSCQFEFNGDLCCFERLGKHRGRRASSGFHARRFRCDSGTADLNSIFEKSALGLLAAFVTGRDSEITERGLSFKCIASATASQSSRHPSSTSSSLTFPEKQALVLLLLLPEKLFPDLSWSKVFWIELFTMDRESLPSMKEPSVPSPLFLPFSSYGDLFSSPAMCLDVRQ